MTKTRWFGLASTGPDQGPARKPALRRVRINFKAAVAILVGVAVSILAYFLILKIQDGRVRNQVIASAVAFEKSGDVDLAIRNLSVFLNTHPSDIGAMDVLARIMAQSTRSVGEALSAAAINDRLLRLDPDGPGRQDTRRRLVELYVRYGDAHRASAIYRLSPESASYELRYRAAEAIARDLLARGETVPADHRLLATALEGLAVPGGTTELMGAIQEYEKAIQGDPGDYISAERLARLCQDRLNDPSRGERILDSLISSRPTAPEARLIRYRYFARMHRNDRAMAELEEATKLSPDDLEVRLTAASDSVRRGDPISARRHLDAISEASKGDLRVRVTRGMIDFSEERPDVAIDGWRQGLLTIGGTDSDLTWWLAHALLQMGRIAEARPLVAQYRRLSGGETQPLYRFLQAELDEKSGRPTRAILALEWARDPIGDDWQPMVQMALGRCYEAIWDEARALASYRRANQIDPRRVDPRLAAARLLIRKPEEAVLELEHGLAQVPEEPTLQIAMVNARLRQQIARNPADRSWIDFDRALAAALKTSGGNSQLILMQADRLVIEGKMPAALRLLEQGVEKAPKNSTLWTALAEALSRDGKPDQALRVLERAASPDAAGDRAPIRVARAKLLLGGGRGREAREILVRNMEAVTLGDRPIVWEALGRVNATLGDVTAARAAYGEWAKLLPDDPRPRLAMIELAQTVGDEAAVRSTVASLRDLGGPEDIAWRLCRAQELLWARTTSDQPLSRRDPRLDEANRLLETVLVDAPEIPVAHLLRGQVLERLNKTEEAISAYRRAWDRGAPMALTKLVGLLTRLRRFDDLAGLRLKAPAVQIDQLSAIASYRGGDLDAANRFIEQAARSGADSPGTRLWQARMLETIGKPDQADAALVALAEQNPAELDPWMNLIRSLATHGKDQQAATTVEQARARVKHDNPLLVEASLYWAANDRPAADRAFQAAMADRPEDVLCRITASHYYETTGRNPEALACLKEALRIDPKHRPAFRQMALLLSYNPATWDEAVKMVGSDTPPGEPAEDRLARAMVLSQSTKPAPRARSIEVFEQLVGDLPTENAVATTARDRLARLYLDAGRADRACQLALISAQSGTNPPAMALYIEALLQAKNFPEALHQIDQLAAFKPGDPIEASYRVRWIRESNRPGDAASLLEKAAKERRDLPGGELFARMAFAALIEMGSGALDQADRVGRIVADRRPSASWMEAKVLSLRGRPGEAIDLCRAGADSNVADDRRGAVSVAVEIAIAPDASPADQARVGPIVEAALKHDPKNYDVVTMTASYRHLFSQFEDEVRLYRTALEVRPGDLVASNNLAWALSEGVGQADQALVLLDETIRRHGRLDWVLDTRGVILTRLGRFDEAISTFKEAAGDHPSPLVLFHLARACLKANRNEDFRRFRDEARRSGISPKEVDSSERNELVTLMSL